MPHTATLNNIKLMMEWGSSNFQIHWNISWTNIFCRINLSSFADFFQFFLE